MALGAASVVISSGFLIITEVLIIMGNILVIVAVAKNISMHTVTNLFVVNLSITDLLVAVFNCPFMFVSIVAGDWVLGHTMCQFSGFLNVVFCCASILTLTAISIDRYYCITRPTKAVITKSKAVLMMGLIWLIVILFAMMPILGWNKYIYVNARKHCMIYWQMGGKHSAYAVFLSVSSFIIPTWIMIFCYYKIFRTAHSQAKKFKNNNERNLVNPRLIGSNTSRGSNNAHVHSGLKTIHVIPRNSRCASKPSKHTITRQRAPESRVSNHAQATSGDSTVEHAQHLTPADSTQSAIANEKIVTSESSLIVKEKRERRTAKVILIVIGVFQVCWLPYAALNQWSAFSGSDPPGKADLASSLLAYFNSACNAFIYTLFNPRFRQAFKRILCGKRAIGMKSTMMSSQSRLKHRSAATQQPCNKRPSGVILCELKI